MNVCICIRMMLIFKNTAAAVKEPELERITPLHLIQQIPLSLHLPGCLLMINNYTYYIIIILKYLFSCNLSVTKHWWQHLKMKYKNEDQTTAYFTYS